MIWLKRQSVYHTKHHVTSKVYCSQVICTTYDTFMTQNASFCPFFLSWQLWYSMYKLCGDSLKKMHLLYSKLLFSSFKGIWQIIPTCHLTAKQSSFWVSNILKNQLHAIYPYGILIFLMHHAVMTCYDVNGKWRNCCPKQSILKIWIEITLFFSHSPPFPS